MNRKKLLLILTCGIVLFEVFLLQKGESRSLQKLIDKVYTTCSAKSYSLSCYDEEIPKLMDSPINLSLEDAFLVTRGIQQKDQRYLYCHVLGHKISARETRKDPSKWKDVLTHCPTTMCNNGCLHGALMERFKTEHLTDTQIQELKPDLKDVCEPRGSWRPVEVERSMCYHALGHLHMFITNASLQKSVDLCNEIAKKSDGRDYIQTCTEGVFMEVYQPLEPEDLALVKDLIPDKNEVKDFCSPYTGEAWDACHREAWPLFRADILSSPKDFVDFCSYTVNEEAQNKCYGAIMNMITPEYFTNRYSPEEFKKYCLGLPEEKQPICFANATIRLIQIDPIYTDKALGICKMAEDLGKASLCYRDFAYFGSQTYAIGSEKFLSYCDKLPAPWNTKCINQNYNLE